MLNPASESSALSIIRKHHPLFKKITPQGTKKIFLNGQIVKLKASQILYKEGYNENMAYVVIYGKAVIWTIEEGVLGVADLNNSVGEEAFIAINYKSR